MTRATRALVLAMCIAVACASAGNPGNAPGDATGQVQSDAPVHHDARVFEDAASHLDGHAPIDAPVDAPAVIPDAPVGSGGEVCLENSDCTDPGTCCYFFTCTLGVGVGSNLCFSS